MESVKISGDNDLASVNPTTIDQDQELSSYLL